MAKTEPPHPKHKTAGGSRAKQSCKTSAVCNVCFATAHTRMHTWAAVAVVHTRVVALARERAVVRAWTVLAVVLHSTGDTIRGRVFAVAVACRNSVPH